MQAKVELQVKARFGKKSGTSDYEWLIAPGDLPQNIRSICEPLAEAADSSSAFITLVTEEQQSVWLVRVYNQGMDNAFRAVTGLEVAELISPPTLTRDHWLALAIASIQPSERERIGTSNTLVLGLTPLKSGTSPPDKNLIMRARLGLPIATTPQAAYHLLNQSFWKYKGVCLALSGKSNPALEWIDILAPYVCVNVSEPQLSTEDQAVMDAVVSRPPSSTEWAILDGLDSKPVRQALRWSVDKQTRPPIESDQDPLRHWLAAFRAEQYKDAELLKVLKRDFKPHPLPSDIISYATKNLSDTSAAFIVDAVSGVHSSVKLEVLEDLARRSYLAEGDIVPLRLWANRAAESPLLAEQALRRFADSHISREAAAFVLNLERPGEDLNSQLPDDLVEAASMAHKAGLPIPKRSFLQALDHITNRDQLRVVEKISSVYGGWAEVITRLIADATIPDQGILDSQELAATLSARARLIREPRAALDAIAYLVNEQRIEEASNLLIALKRSSSGFLEPEEINVIEARLDRASPGLPPRVEELRTLVRRGLARPQDIILDSASEDEIAAYASLWDETKLLASILDNGEDGFIQGLPTFPQSWTRPVHGVLNQDRIAGWMKRLDPDYRTSARRWFLKYQGVTQDLADTLCGRTESSINRKEVLIILPWLKSLTEAEPYENRLRGLCNAAAAALAHKDDSLASSLTEALLPEANEQTHDLVSYALSGVGPLPSADEVSPGLVSALATVMDPATLADIIMASNNTALSSDLQVIETVTNRLRQYGFKYPAHGYTARQCNRHLEFAVALSRVCGWENMYVDEPAYLEHMVEALNKQGISPQRLIAFLQEKVNRETNETNDVAAERE